MVSNSRQRSASSASRTRSSRNRSSARPTTVKGRPSQSRSLRRSSSATSPRTRTASSSYSARSQRSSARSRNQSEQPLRSVSVSDVHNAARYRSKRAARRLPIVVIVGVILVAVLGIAGVVLANSGVFTVRQVTVSGVSHITAEEMTELAAVPEGTTLLNVDANGITSRLTSNPWVQSASVDRAFPDTLNLNVTERTISAVVSVTVDESNTVERWALASDGMWLTELPDQNSAEGQALPASVYEDAANALEITDIPYGSSPEAGKYCNNANVENALSIIDGMTTELANQIKSVSAASSNSTTLTLDNGVEIAFGDSQDIRDKERVCLELLQEHEGKISYINVRVVNKPVWRSL